MYADVKFEDINDNVRGLIAMLVTDHDVSVRPLVDGNRYYITNDHLMTQVQFDFALSLPVKLEKVRCWVEMPVTQLEENVDSSMPDCTHIGEDDEEQPRAWKDYAPFGHKVNKDGDTVLVQCVHAPVSGASGNGLMNDELRLWHSLFGGKLICLQEYKNMVATDEWPGLEGI